MANDLRDFYKAIEDAREVMRKLLDLHEQLQDIQRDYDAGEIPPDHKRSNCFQDCGLAVNNAVLDFMHEIKYKMEGDQ